MFEYVRNNQRLVQVFLVLITLPFAFWGVESYVRNAGSGNDVADVGGSKVTAQEFQQTLREEQERLRPALGGRDPALLESPEIRLNVLNGLVSQRLIRLHAGTSKLVVVDDQLAQFIASAPALQENGKFSPQRYEMLVASQGVSKEGFEARLRQDMVVQQALVPINAATIPGRTASERWVAALLEEREVAELALRPEAYLAQVKLAPEAVKNYYDMNRKPFETPELVRAEYVTLSQNALLAQIAVGDEDVKGYYEAHADQYKVGDERHASHILIAASKDAAAAEDKAARDKAEDVLAQVKKNPADFARLAKQYSQDPGSAAKGGDLGWFGRGMMVPPFENAVFALKGDEVSPVVRSDFGYHIIKLTGVKPVRQKPLDEVKNEIVSELKRQGAAKKYAEIAEGFTNTVYEQADSLKPAAEKYKLAVQTSDWIAKNGQAAPPFANPKLMTALFADDAIKNRRNTEAVEIAPNTLVAARVLEHKPAALQPLEAVAANIEKLLVRQEAAKLAAKDGEEKLARLVKGEKLDLAWSAPRTVARAAAANQAPEAVRAVFKADAAQLPAYAGTAHPGGYVLYRISQVKPYLAGSEDSPRAKSLRAQYRNIVAEEEFGGWLGTLKQRFPVDINKSMLDNKEK
ncbi:MAG: SurA N-terminal domain-containing protein [Rhodocyclales bacterium]|nr:SurA N-terminal domain-containing protein [Rhodocyclales bacterium]